MAEIVLDKPGEKPRIGVYVCHCGGNISDTVDVAKVAEALKGEADVVVSKHILFDCSDASQNEMIEDIKNLNLNRLVTCACSPKLHEATFRGVAQRAGLNQYLSFHANIREQSSWPHGDDPAGATAKALAQARSAIAYMRDATPMEALTSGSTQSVLVIGAGITGLRSALDLASMGVQVYLIERLPYLGGHSAQVGGTYPTGTRGDAIVRDLVGQLLRKPNVTVFTNATVESQSGYVGNFEIRVHIAPRVVVGPSAHFNDAIAACPVSVPDEFEYGRTARKAIYQPRAPVVPNLPVIDLDHCTRCGKCPSILGGAVDFSQRAEVLTLKVGSIIVATGFDPYTPPQGEFGYGAVPNVVTLPQFERLLATEKGPELTYLGRKVRSLAYIYCVGSRQKRAEGDGGGPVHEYCSRFCCNATVNNDLHVHERFPEIRAYHFYRDMRTYGRNELMYEQAAKQGSIFVRYSEDNPPRVTTEDGHALVTVQASILEHDSVAFPVDLVVLVTGMVPRDNQALNDLFSLPIGPDGFYKEVHQKLRPVETNVTGLLIAGTAQFPKDIKETLLSGSAAAAKASTFALKTTLELEPFVASVDTSVCEASGGCLRECPFGAIEMHEYEGIGKRAWVNSAVCKGCGACVAVCPTEAIQLAGLTNPEVRDMIEALAR